MRNYTLYSFCLSFNEFLNCTCSPSLLSFSNSYRDSSVSWQLESFHTKHWWDHIFLKITKACIYNLEIKHSWVLSHVLKYKSIRRNEIGAGRPSSPERMSGSAPLRLEPDAELMPQSPQKRLTKSLRQSIRFILFTNLAVNSNDAESPDDSFVWSWAWLSQNARCGSNGVERSVGVFVVCPDLWNSAIYMYTRCIWVYGLLAESWMASSHARTAHHAPWQSLGIFVMRIVIALPWFDAARDFPRLRSRSTRANPAT